MTELTTKDLYFSYSPPQYRFIKASGIKFLCTGLSENTSRQFWAYQRTPGLDNVLKQYSAAKPSGL
ncbi:MULTISPECIES: hypothetical protein [Peribacillus]|uniref:hypothetical protein n=1 Tax=Peribacillus TaxID=2675229 RepID=UPI001F4EADD2|nr:MULTISPECIES: hypothetical protein [unclassified Peribacillus]MCK1985182.1 hypothetical protein [Peribacillus sp. Aquil_B1]MCK2007168.1 hypothetical protein [Peribacillus sp. Aquil_B8]